MGEKRGKRKRKRKRAKSSTHNGVGMKATNRKRTNGEAGSRGNRASKTGPAKQEGAYAESGTIHPPPTDSVTAAEPQRNKR